MRLRQAVAGLRNAEIAIVRVSAQAIGFEILVAIVTDGDALFRPRARLCGRQPPRLGLAILLAILGLDMFSRGGSGSSAGLISLECATVTANSGPSSFSSQKERKSFSAGKFGNRS